MVELQPDRDATALKTVWATQMLNTRTGEKRIRYSIHI